MNELIFLLIIIILIFISMPFIYIYNLTEERLETIINKVEPLNQYMKLKIEEELSNNGISKYKFKKNYNEALASFILAINSFAVSVILA